MNADEKTNGRAFERGSGHGSARCGADIATCRGCDRARCARTLTKPALILILSKKPTSARCIATGWLAMWRLVLSKIPVVRAMCGLQQLVPGIKKKS